MAENKFAKFKTGEAPANKFDAFKPKKKEPATWAETGLDIVGGVVTGINKGVASLPGLPGTVEQLTRMGINKLGGEGTVRPEAMLPTAEDTIKLWEDFSGKLPEQTTAPGQYAEAIGEFIPGGTGGVGRKLATAVAGGGLSKAVGDVTGSPLGNLIGGLLGTILARGRKTSPEKLLSKSKDTPSSSATFRAKEKAFEDIKGMNIEHPVSAYEPAVKNIKEAVGDLEARKLAAPQAASLIRRFTEALGETPKPTLGKDVYLRDEWKPAPPDTRTVPHTEVEAIRREAGALTGNPNPDMASERALAGILRAEIDKLNNANPQLEGVLPAAREFGRRHILDRTMGEMIRKSKWYKSGSDAGIGLQASSYGKRHGTSLTDFENAALNKVVHPDKITRGLEILGKAGIDLSPHSGKNWIGPMISSAISWPLLAAGTVANPIASRRLEGLLEKTRKMARVGKPGQQALKDRAAALNAKVGKSVPGGVLGSIISAQPTEITPVEGGFMINGKFVPKKKAK